MDNVSKAKLGAKIYDSIIAAIGNKSIAVGDIMEILAKVINFFLNEIANQTGYSSRELVKDFCDFLTSLNAKFDHNLDVPE